MTPKELEEALAWADSWKKYDLPGEERQMCQAEVLAAECRRLQTELADTRKLFTDGIEERDHLKARLSQPCSCSPDARGKWMVIEANARAEQAESRAGALEKALKEIIEMVRRDGHLFNKWDGPCIGEYGCLDQVESEVRAIAQSALEKEGVE